VFRGRQVIGCGKLRASARHGRSWQPEDGIRATSKAILPTGYRTAA
jgi:hypothetical protein